MPSLVGSEMCIRDRIGIYLRREGGESLGILGSNAGFPNHLRGASIKSRLGAVSTRIMCGPEQSCLRVPAQSEKAVLGTKKLGTESTSARAQPDQAGLLLKG